MIRIEEIFSKIPNKVILGEEQEKSVMRQIGDAKVILILHELQLNTTLKNKSISNISIEKLVKECGYESNKKMNLDFKDILLQLRKLKLINFTDFKSNKELIEVDLKAIAELDFTQLYPSELKVLHKVKDKRNFLNLLKVYMLLKKCCYKRSLSDYDIVVTGGRSETTFLSYKFIAINTNIDKKYIKKYIDQLQELNLIRYANLGTKYKIDSKTQKIEECNNIYALTYISGVLSDAKKNDEQLRYTLKEGLKQQKNDLEEQGYKIVNSKKQVTSKGNIITKQQKGGIVSSINKKINNMTATTDDIEKLEEVTGEEIENDIKNKLKKLEEQRKQQENEKFKNDTKDFDLDDFIEDEKSTEDDVQILNNQTIENDEDLTEEELNDYFNRADIIF